MNIDNNIKYKIEGLEDLFIISTVDKSENNFAIICKQFYYKILINEYQSNSINEKFSGTEIILKKRLLVLLKRNNIKFSNFDFPYLKLL